MKGPLVSVITAVYNGAATLEATIQSVIGQTYPHVELVIVDGGSTDGSQVIAERYKAHIGSFVSEPDKGVYDAMNKGVRMARGEWLYFLGSDDLLVDEGVLNMLFSGSFREDCELLYGDVTSPSFKGLYDGQFDFRKLLSRNISHQAIFYNRTIFERIGVYNLRYRMHADWDLNLRCFADPAVHPKYVRVTVARFGAGGVSAGHDELFLRERLIPAKLRQLNLDGTRKLRHVGQYDEWWRVLRNAGIRDVGELQKYTGKEALPGAIRRIVKWQQHLGPAALRRGLASKARMLLAYIRERVIPSRDD